MEIVVLSNVKFKPALTATATLLQRNSTPIFDSAWASKHLSEEVNVSIH